METITFLNNACHLSDSESGSKAGTSPLMSDLWGKVIPVRTLMWYHMGWRREEKKKKNRFEPLLSSRSPLCRSGQCVCVHAGGMFSVIVHCIRSG